MVKSIVEISGPTVGVAAGALRAIERLQCEAVDFVFMDMQMPEIDGYETVSQIRGIDNIIQPIIVALTAHALKGLSERCLAAGMDDYLSKPVSPERLQAVRLKWLAPGKRGVNDAAAVAS
ncbi:MAG: response regulator [Thiotrichales bacterium]